MATATGGSGSSPPGKTNGQKNTGHGVPKLKIPVSGDGKSLKTAMWSSDLTIAAPGYQRTYVVYQPDQLPKWTRTILSEAHSHAELYTIYDRDTYKETASNQLPYAPVANPSMVAASGIN
ncbi:hypothetical protein EK21DRAFT_58149 [Setomelanomma holmii]|uniref:Uncharacterized protein n=1 Tax=Setomelanomma holmii TaxID=210430 RepID=A0A9P4HHJ4_9PLEO|nr:hypothetical protein EK21DRAFT_58149 [Setomelanomma holmii]